MNSGPAGDDDGGGEWKGSCSIQRWGILAAGCSMNDRQSRNVLTGDLL